MEKGGERGRETPPERMRRRRGEFLTGICVGEEGEERVSRALLSL